MGDMSAEPSMEDILASIKRIIAEDAESGAQLRARRRAPAPALAPNAADEVLELSEPAPQPVHFRPGADEPMPISPVVEAPVAAEPPAAAPHPVEPKPAAAQPVTASAPSAETIVSAETAEASRAPLDTLSKLVVKPETRDGVTLEALVREMLRPMLRDWLDKHLPPMVETMVAKEIARITGGR